MLRLSRPQSGKYCLMRPEGSISNARQNWNNWWWWRNFGKMYCIISTDVPAMLVMILGRTIGKITKALRNSWIISPWWKWWPNMQSRQQCKRKNFFIRKMLFMRVAFGRCWVLQHHLKCELFRNIHEFPSWKYQTTPTFPKFRLSTILKDGLDQRVLIYVNCDVFCPYQAGKGAKTNLKNVSRGPLLISGLLREKSKNFQTRDWKRVFFTPHS